MTAHASFIDLLRPQGKWGGCYLYSKGPAVPRMQTIKKEV